MVRLPIDDSDKPLNPALVLPRGVSAHNTPNPAGNVGKETSESGGRGGGRWQIPRSPPKQGDLQRRIAPDHGRGKPSRCLSTIQHLWQTLGFFRRSIFFTQYAQPAPPRALQRVKPPVPAKISPAGRTTGVQATRHPYKIAHLPYFLGAPTSEKEKQLFEKPPNSWENLIPTVSDRI